MVTFKIVRIALLVTVLAGASSLMSCYDIGPQKTSSLSSAQSVQVTIGGRVVFREKDGGFFGILADNGKQFEPMNLDPAFHTEGLRVQIAGSLDTTRLGKHAWGNPIELDRVKTGS